MGTFGEVLTDVHSLILALQKKKNAINHTFAFDI